MTIKNTIISRIASIIEKHPKLVWNLNLLSCRASPGRIIWLDYPVNPRQRWKEGAPHPKLNELISSQADSYTSLIEEFIGYTGKMASIPLHDSGNSMEPAWINGWLPALDAIALYSILAMNNPELYIEVGSGNSTKFARRAIMDNKLKTRITSIDPAPRTEINSICDEVIRKPVEDIDSGLFMQLRAGDILYIDNSHRCLMNSDVTAVFMDIIPNLAPGVIVQIHDIFLPYDYPAEWQDRYYSEQYLLASYLLGKNSGSSIIFPGHFASRDIRLSKSISRLFKNPPISQSERTSGCFWLKT